VQILLSVYGRFNNNILVYSSWTQCFIYRYCLIGNYSNGTLQFHIPQNLTVMYDPGSIVRYIYHQYQCLFLYLSFNKNVCKGNDWLLASLSVNVPVMVPLLWKEIAVSNNVKNSNLNFICLNFLQSNGQNVKFELLTCYACVVFLFLKPSNIKLRLTAFRYLIYDYIYQSKQFLALYEEKHTKILLVDDEPDILEIVGYNLSLRVSNCYGGKW
jgi:hypothetical protein